MIIWKIIDGATIVQDTWWYAKQKQMSDIWLIEMLAQKIVRYGWMKQI